MLKALSNVAPRHLLDTRLNPPGDLRATVRHEVRLKPDANLEGDKPAGDRHDRQAPLRIIRSVRL
jgi:hypothetical protein